MLWTVAVVGLAVSMMVIDRLLQRVGDTFFTNFAAAPVLACVSAATVGAAVDPTSTPPPWSVADGKVKGTDSAVFRAHSWLSTPF